MYAGVGERHQRRGQAMGPAFGPALLMVFAVLAVSLVSVAFLPPSVAAESLAAQGFPRVVVDGLGKEIVLEAPPQRIFSTGLAMDNILLSIVEPERVVGVSHYAADPQGSYVTDKIRDHMILIDALNAELVVAAQPDIVLVAFWSNQDEVRLIEDLGYAVYTFTGFSTVQDALDNIRRVGEITGNEAEAKQLIDAFWQRYDAVRERVEGRPRPAVLSWDSWLTTTGVGTSMHDIIEMAGGVNLAAEHGIEGWQPIDAETIIAMAPQVIITHEGEEWVWRILEDPVLQTVPAVREGKVYSIQHAEALNHHFILAIEQLAELLHPEAF